MLWILSDCLDSRREELQRFQVYIPISLTVKKTPQFMKIEQCAILLSNDLLSQWKMSTIIYFPMISALSCIVIVDLTGK